MKKLLASVLCFTLYGCSTYQADKGVESTTVTQCVGSTQLEDQIAHHFESIDDTALLESTLGEPNEGKLCQGQVYRSKENSNIVLFRAWNSTNQNSQFGQWWAFNQPAGRVAQYRSNYEICYQWSPLDKLVKCTLKPNTKVVVGTGQSAQCSDYLTYPVSDQQQMYIEDASESLMNCTVFDGVFSWKAL